MTPNEIRKRGIEALSKALGPIGMVRFLQQFDAGTGDYTAERKQWLQDLKLEDVIDEIKRRRKKPGTRTAGR
ncbi:MAG: hypothetical protein HY673_08975 [Chloroflexi bacterium]|nr:hypothetical protein [Chloroflexota bacterium]